MRFFKTSSCLVLFAALDAGALVAEHVTDNSTSLESILLTSRAEAGLMNLNVVNNLPSDNVRLYIQMDDPATNNMIFIKADSSAYVPQPSSKMIAQEIPPEEKCGIQLGAQGSITRVQLPQRLVNARFTVADGEMSLSALQLDSGYSVSVTDSNRDTHWGFLEINQAVDNYGNDKSWMNPSYVDFAGLALPFSLASEKSGEVANVQGFPPDGVKKVCDLLQEAENQDGIPWTSLCSSDRKGNLIRVASPMVAPHPEGFSTYWDSNIDDVWAAIASRGISFDLQDGRADKVNCTMTNNEMWCGDVGPFIEPCSDDIWKCNGGPFRAANNDYGHIASRFCAAFHRGTLLISGGEVQPSLLRDSYYPQGQTYNKYAKFMHQVQIDGIGYTFPTDDTKPSIQDLDISGLVSVDDASELTIYVGGLNPAEQNDWSDEAATTVTKPTPTTQPPDAHSTTDRLPPVFPTSDQVTTTTTLPSLMTISTVTTPLVTTIEPTAPAAAPMTDLPVVSTGSDSTETQYATITGPVQMVNGDPMAMVTDSILVIVHQTTYVRDSAAVGGPS